MPTRSPITIIIMTAKWLAAPPFCQGRGRQATGHVPRSGPKRRGHHPWLASQGAHQPYFPICAAIHASKASRGTRMARPKRTAGKPLLWITRYVIRRESWRNACVSRTVIRGEPWLTSVVRGLDITLPPSLNAIRVLAWGLACRLVSRCATLSITIHFYTCAPRQRQRRWRPRPGEWPRPPSGRWSRSIDCETAEPLVCPLVAPTSHLDA